MPYIVVILIVICLLPMVPLFWYGITDANERKPHHLAMAILCSIVMLMMYGKIVSFLVSTVSTLLF